MKQVVYYAQLEQGARYLASLASTHAERQQHLAWANRYYRLAVDARESRQAPPLKVAA
jgi:hypothetical protein